MGDEMEEIKKLLIDNEIISKDGIKVSGNGIIIKKLEEIEKLSDKQNLKLYYLEKKLEDIANILKSKV